MDRGPAQTSPEGARARMILHLYFARRFAATFALVSGIFVGIMFLIALVDQVRRFEGEDVSFLAVFGLTALSLPETLYTLLPLLAIISALVLSLSLSRTSELVVARASGRSGLLSLTGPVAVALVTGIAAAGALNPIVAASTARYDMVADGLAGGQGSVLSLSDEGLWLRQGDGNGQTVIRADRANAQGTVLSGVTFLGFDRAGRPSFRVEGLRATLESGAWVVEQAKEWRFDAPNPEASARTFETLRLPSSLTQGQIADSFAAPSAVPLWELPRFISQLERAGFSARRHLVWLHMQLALPLLLVSMVLSGAAFTMRPGRQTRTGLMVLTALSLGFALFFIRNFAQILGENGQIPILLAAWGPPVAAILLPTGLILHWEDG